MSQNQTLSPGAIVGIVLLAVVVVMLFVTLLIAFVVIWQRIKAEGIENHVMCCFYVIMTLYPLIGVKAVIILYSG